MFYRSLFVLLAIVLSVLRFTDSDYPFRIFKLFLTSTTGTYYHTKITVKQICTTYRFFKCWNQSQHDQSINIYFYFLLQMLIT